MKRKFNFHNRLRTLIRWFGMGAFASLLVLILSCGGYNNRGYNGSMNPYVYAQQNQNPFINNFNRFNNPAIIPGTFNQQAQTSNLGCVAQLQGNYSSFEQGCSACNGIILNTGGENVCKYNVNSQPLNGKLINLTPRGLGFPPRRMGIQIFARPFSTVEVEADVKLGRKKASRRDDDSEYNSFYIYLQDPGGLSTSDMITDGSLGDLNLSMLTPVGSAYFVVEASRNISVVGRAYVMSCESSSGQMVRCPPGSSKMKSSSADPVARR